MSKLLVSVRSADEAQAALDGGASIIDVKEPSLGSLGRASEAAIAAVVNRVARRIPISAALGDLDEHRAEYSLDDNALDRLDGGNPCRRASEFQCLEEDPPVDGCDAHLERIGEW